MTTINYWLGDTSSNEWDDAANWSTSIADGQIAVLNEGSNPIEGGTFAAATGTVTITDFSKLNTGDKVNLIATDTTNYDFVCGDQSLVAGTWEPTTSNAVTATNLMNVVNTSSGPSGTRFTATVDGAVVTVTQATGGTAGNTTITLTDPLDGMSKTNFTGGGTNWSAIYVGPGFTGSIGTKLDPLKIATTAMVVGGGTSVYMELYDSTADGASVPRVLTLHNWPATVNIQDSRTATTLNVRVLAASGAISTATLSFDEAITTFVVSGLTVETVSVVGEDIGTLRVDGGVVQGGDVTGTAHISGGTWESGDAANLILYGGQVLGGVGRETVIGSLIMMGGAFSLEQATGYNVQLPSVIALYPFATLDLRTDGIRPTCSVYFPGGGTVRVPASTTVTAS